MNTGKQQLARELPKNRRRTEVSVSYSGSPGAVGRHNNIQNRVAFGSGLMSTRSRISRLLAARVPRIERRKPCRFERHLIRARRPSDVDYFFRHYDSCCYMPERGRIHHAASNASPISPDHETSSDRRRAACDNRCRLCGLCVLLRDWHEPEKARPHRRAFSFPRPLSLPATDKGSRDVSVLGIAEPGA